MRVKVDVNYKQSQLCGGVFLKGLRFELILLKSRSDVQQVGRLSGELHQQQHEKRSLNLYGFGGF